MARRIGARAVLPAQCALLKGAVYVCVKSLFEQPKMSVIHTKKSQIVSGFAQRAWWQVPVDCG
jgi:hypothetical protein